MEKISLNNFDQMRKKQIFGPFFAYLSEKPKMIIFRLSIEYNFGSKDNLYKRNNILFFIHQLIFLRILLFIFDL